MLKVLWKGWKSVAKKIGAVQSRLVLSLFYFVVLGPFALAVRARDPMNLRSRTSWHGLPRRDASTNMLTALTQQF